MGFCVHTHVEKSTIFLRKGDFITLLLWLKYLTFVKVNINRTLFLKIVGIYELFAMSKAKSYSTTELLVAKRRLEEKIKEQEALNDRLRGIALSQWINDRLKIRRRWRWVK